MGPTQPPIQGFRAISCPGVKWAGTEIEGLNVGLLKLQGGGEHHTETRSESNLLLFDDSKL